MRQAERQNAKWKFIALQQEHLRTSSTRFKDVITAGGTSTHLPTTEIAAEPAPAPPSALLLQTKTSSDYYSRSWSFSHGQGRKILSTSSGYFRLESMLLLLFLTAMLLLLPLLLPPLPPPPFMLLLIPICLLLLLMILAFMPSPSCSNRKHV